MKKFLFILGLSLGLGLTASAAPTVQYFRNISPETNATYDLGTTTKKWKDLYVNGINLNGTYRTSWPTSSGGGGGGGFWATSTDNLVGYPNLDTGYAIVIGDDATTSPNSIFEVIGNQYLSGNLGIGTTSPYAKLSVVGETVSQYFTATSTTATSTFYGPMQSLLNTYTRYKTQDLFSDPINLHTTLQSVADNSATRFHLMPNGTVASGLAAGIKVFGTDYAADNVNYDDFGLLNSSDANRLNTKKNGTGASKDIWVTYDDDNVIAAFSRLGRVGIGTTSPQANLHVYGTGAASTRVQSLGSDAYLYLRAANDQQSYLFFGDVSDDDVGGITYDHTNNSLSFRLNATNDRMNILSTGLVGIGTTSPYAKLSVVGETVAEKFTATSTTATSTFPNIVASNNLDIPSSADPVVSTAGEIAINTTAASSSLRYHDGTAERSLYSTYDRNFSFASSTLAYSGAYGAAGTTTILLSNPYRPLTLVSFYCKTDTGTAILQFTDGTNGTDSVTCSTSGAGDDGSITNNTWNMREDFKAAIGSITGAPSYITVTATLRDNAD